METQILYGKVHHVATPIKDDASPWLVVSLLDTYVITYVKIKNRKDCCSKYNLLHHIDCHKIG